MLMNLVTMPVRNSQPQGDSILPVLNMVDAALVRLLEGTSEDASDLVVVGMALNLADSRLRWVTGGTDGKAMLRRAGLVIMECEQASPPTLRLHSPEAQQLVIDGVDLYADLMRKSTPLQIEQAKRNLAERIRQPARKVHRA